MGEKTEKATPKKMRDARKKGQVAKSQDLPSAFTFIVSVWAVLGMSHFLYNKMGAVLAENFKLINYNNLETILPSLYMSSIMDIFYISLPILVIVSVIGVVVNFLAVGPVFTTEVFKFDPKKFDPVQNLKAKFKLKTLIELLKSCIKITVAGYLVYLVMWHSIPVLIKTLDVHTSTALLVFYTFLKEVIIKVGIFFVIVAVADFAYQKKSFAKEMKMEKFEIKQEYKNTEGDPHIKGKRKQIAQEIAFGEGPSGGIKNAKAVVTNPTHLAIAIGYNRDTDAAPYILGMGENLIAEQMIRFAKMYNVPIVRNIRLAHKLWDEGELHEFIPEEAYEATAEILRWIAALDTEKEYDYQETDLD
ncbi:MAG: type III secretion system export apparatus subunit SctU [Parachlamydiales bacterium]|jgi:type III secretion YscU/HrpY family protein